MTFKLHPGSVDLKTEAIKKLLEERGISDALLGAKIGVSRQTSWNWRNGRATTTKLETAQKIANFLEVPLEVIAAGSLTRYNQGVLGTTSGFTTLPNHRSIRSLFGLGRSD